MKKMLLFIAFLLSSIYTYAQESPAHIFLNGELVGSTLQIPCGCTTPLVFTTDASIASWLAPGTWTPPAYFGNTFTVSPDEISGGKITLKYGFFTPPNNGTTWIETVTVIRTTPRVGFDVNTPKGYCTPANGVNFSVANALAGLCGVSSFTYTLSGNLGPTFVANNSQTLTTNAPWAQVNFPAGTYTVDLSVVVNYPCGSSVASTITLTLSSVPPAPTSMTASRLGNSCYYDARVSRAPNADRYYWSVDGAPYHIGTMNAIDAFASEFFLGPSSEYVRVFAANACGYSAVYSKNLNIPSPPAGCQLQPNQGNGNVATSGQNTNERAESVDGNEQPTDGFEFRLYPVPAENFLYIESKSPSTCTMTLINASGRIVASDYRIEPGMNEIKFDLPTGIYLARLVGESKTYTEKIYVK